MNKPDYNKLMKEEMQIAKKGSKLLLHSCCGPCSSRCLEVLKSVFDVSVLFYNPNITDKEEYNLRKAEQIRFLKQSDWAKICNDEYNVTDFFNAVSGLEKEKEGGARCYKCYELRLEYTAKKAKNEGYDYFCTTLSVSPHKNSEWLNEIGIRLAGKYGVKYLPADFKKENGYLRSVELAKEYDLYRQNYCGCCFSDWRKKV